MGSVLLRVSMTVTKHHDQKACRVEQILCAVSHAVQCAPTRAVKTWLFSDGKEGVCRAGDDTWVWRVPRLVTDEVWEGWRRVSDWRARVGMSVWFN